MFPDEESREDMSGGKLAESEKTEKNLALEEKMELYLQASDDGIKVQMAGYGPNRLPHIDFNPSNIGLTNANAICFWPDALSKIKQ